MSIQTPIPRSYASLQRHFLWLLLIVTGMFAVGIALSLWFSLQSAQENQQHFIEHEAEQARADLTRQLDYYRELLGKAAGDPALVGLLRSGSLDEQQAWALTRQGLLPDLRGLALINPRGEVLGDIELLGVSSPDQEDGQRVSALEDGRPLLHRETGGGGHIELIAAVRDAGGELLGGVFLSIELDRLQRWIDASTHAEHAIALVDAQGTPIVSRGEVTGPLRETRRPLAETGWILVARAPVQWLTRSSSMQVVAGLLTLAAVLVILIWGMLRLQRTMLSDIVATRDALTALARDEPVPSIVPHYIEFEAAAADINLVALHLQEQKARLEHLSLTDPLTGLPNRRAFETRFPQAQGLAERQHPVALVLLDIDHFKAVNDRYGHGVGDQVLLALAQSLKDLTRRADLPARLAGDEFVVLLTDLDNEGLQAWHQRLVDRFRNELNAFGLDLPTGFSVGQTWLGPASRDSIDDALMRADHALYEAKAQGRGTIVQYVDPGADDVAPGTRT